VNLLGRFTEEEQLEIMNSTYRSTRFSEHIELYNLREDPGETNDVSEKNPEMVALILKLAEAEKTALGEYARKGPEVRKTLSNESPVTLIE
jgi:hypothetical protein